MYIGISSRVRARVSSVLDYISMELSLCELQEGISFPITSIDDMENVDNRVKKSNDFSSVVSHKLYIIVLMFILKFNTYHKLLLSW